jgi:exonuclease III
MTDIYKMATLNVNGLTSFLRTQEIEITFLQEVTQTLLNNLNRYTAYTNERTTRWGTVILVTEGVILTNDTRLSKGRVKATEYQGTRVVNIYTPSGAASKSERENYSNSDLTYLLPASTYERILTGDFSCVLAKTECTGQLTAEPWTA